MTRKHYIALARKLNSVRPDVTVDLNDPEEAGLYNGWSEAVSAVADMCESDNERFNRGRFIKACEHGC